MNQHGTKHAAKKKTNTLPQPPGKLHGPCAPEKGPAPTSERGFRRLLYMYGAVTQIELNGFLEMNSIDSEERKRQVKASWLEAAEAFRWIVANESGTADRVSCRQLAREGAAEITSRLSKDPTFTKTFSNFPISFEEVEIDNLVASQRTVHLDFIEHLKAVFEGMGEDSVRFCLDPVAEKTPIKVGRTAPNGLTFSSDNPGLRFLGVSEQPYHHEVVGAHHPGGRPVHTVLLLVGYGSPVANAYRIGRRLILNNGFHRLYALRSLGITHAPLVVQQVTRAELEMPPVVADLPREYLVTAPRPGLMKDFFDDRLICEVHQVSFLKALQVSWGINDSRVPR